MVAIFRPKCFFYLFLSLLMVACLLFIQLYHYFRVDVFLSINPIHKRLGYHHEAGNFWISWAWGNLVLGDFVPLLAKIPPSFCIGLLDFFKLRVYSSYMVIYLNSLLIYSLLLVYYFGNYYSPSSFIPSSSNASFWIKISYQNCGSAIFLCLVY